MTDISIKQGADGGMSWPITDNDGEAIDLTGYSARAQVRRGSTLLHTFSTVAGNILIVGNTIVLTWEAAETTPWRWRGGFYDLELTSPTGGLSKIDRGYVEVVAEYTQ